MHNSVIRCEVDTSLGATNARSIQIAIVKR